MFNPLWAHGSVQQFQLPLVGIAGVFPFSLSFSCVIQRILMSPLLICQRLAFLEQPLDLWVLECKVLEAVRIGTVCDFHHRTA